MIVNRRMIEKPVTIFTATFPDITVTGFFSYIFNPGFHTLILVFQEMNVAIYQIHSPWCNDRNISPSC